MVNRMSDGVAGLIAIGGISLATLAIVREGAHAYSVAMFGLAVAMLAVGVAWLGRQAPGTPFREMAVPAAVATVTPLLVGATVTPLRMDVAPAAPWIIGSAAAAVLGLRLADTLHGPERTPTALVTAGAAVVGGALGILAPALGDDRPALVSVVATVLLATTTVLPGLVSAVLRHAAATTGRDREAIVTALELAVLGLTPGIAILTVWGSGGSPAAAIPLVVWILVVLAAQFFGVRPLARRASLVTTQRDAVVVAMEAERSRIAADIHDDALQELTLLSWRLDAAGDPEGAATAREVADRLRAILGDLRLPILDDLGTGPALEWLVERVARLAATEVRLERADSARPPADVELAFFRVAQEALSNAVRHGRPPIIVRYWTSPSAASLSIDDAGPAGDQAANQTAGQASERGGHGMLNMAQRAEQIGALLNVRTWPSGGTRVTLEWRA